MTTLVTNEESHDYASYERKRAMTTLLTNEESHDDATYKRREP